MTDQQPTRVNTDAARTPLAPDLVVRDAPSAIDFYRTAFGAVEVLRLAGSRGEIMHAALDVNGARVMLVDECVEMGLVGPQTLGGSPLTINLGVDDADAWAERAVAAGATVVMPVSEQFWGDRYGVVRDPFGHQWALVTPTRPPMTEDELRQAACEAFAGA
jgi:uncharacterized glyoxalase superfamily protein PhnB